MSNWTIFSNHGHVLVCLTRNPESRLRDVAADVGITERAVQKIVRDLQDGGMISITKNGRRNFYRIHKKQTVRHQLEAGCKIKDLIRVINKVPAPVKTPKQLLSETGLAASVKAEPRKTVVDTGSEAKSKPIKAKSPQSPKPQKENTGSGKSGHSDNIERQQGSLF